MDPSRARGRGRSLERLLAGEDERLVATRRTRPRQPAGQRADPGRAASATCARRSSARGIDLALLPPGRRLGERDAPRPHDRHDRHRERQVALLQPARCCTCCPATRAPGRSTCIRPRRSPRTRRAACRSCGRPPCATRSTTATRRRRSAPAIRKRVERRAHATPTCCTSASCPTTPTGATSSPTSRWWSWTRRTSTAGVFGSHVANVLRRLRRLARRLRDRAALRAHLGDDRQPARAGAAS